ncbi:hypothetical protein VTN77DRAFT_5817 [Rasamsonia byssochlamydoides]|uniref:uncharacterized protein n=1 Tax=Rasamsonia byssochlamydoides TaxID=89139 RepID=UPI0037435386
MVSKTDLTATSLDSSRSLAKDQNAANGLRSRIGIGLYEERTRPDRVSSTYHLFSWRDQTNRHISHLCVTSADALIPTIYLIVALSMKERKVIRDH